MSREKYRAIAAETDRIVAAGGYRAPSGAHVGIAVAEAVAGTRVHHQGRDDVTGATPRIEVTGESTLQAAARLVAAGPVAALNFASARKPGGGYRNGAQAQEECLARSSALAVTLESVPEFYTVQDARYSDRVIYSPAVPVFRDDGGVLLERPYPVSFLTCAAPNASALTKRSHRAQLPDILRRRAAVVLSVAAEHGHSTVVLGAWGCGVFGNDPAMVADAFAEALARGFGLRHVVFAILDHKPGGPTMSAFRAVFGNSS